MGWMQMELPNLTIKRRYMEIRSPHIGKLHLAKDCWSTFSKKVYLFCSLQGDSPVSDRLEGTSNYNYRVVKEVCSFEF